MAEKGAGVLVLKKAGLVYLANPKTATQALRAMLRPHAGATPGDTGSKHINAGAYQRRWRDKVTAIIGRPAETFAVMREPLAHLGSWYRYRQREALRGHENSTHGISFAEFIEARLLDDPPPFARIGRQDRFLGFLNPNDRPVTYVFDYDRLDLLVLFLAGRLKADLAMPTRNVSPIVDDEALVLPEPLLARLHAVHEGEFALYRQVRDLGVLESYAAE